MGIEDGADVMEIVMDHIMKAFRLSEGTMNYAIVTKKPLRCITLHFGPYCST